MQEVTTRCRHQFDIFLPERLSMGTRQGDTYNHFLLENDHNS